MAILRGEEARRWMAQNPGRSYKDLKTGQTVIGQKSKLAQLGLGLTKPFRAGAATVEELGYTIGDLFDIAKGDFKKVNDRPEKYALLDEAESKTFRENPVLGGLKAGAGVASFGLPGGSALKGLRGIGQAAGRGAIAGGLGGFGYSEEGKELGGTLGGAALGGVLGGALQGIGEGVGKLAANKRSPVSSLSVKEIEALEPKVRKGLIDQAKSSGIYSEALGETNSVKAFLDNRALMGDSPAQTIEKMTQALDDGTRMKQSALEEMPGLSRGYLDEVKTNFEKAIKNKGMTVTRENSLVKKNILKDLKVVGQDAKSLDELAESWYKAGLNARGEQKMGVAGLYKDAAKSLRDVLRRTNPTYDESLKVINKVLNLQEDGTIAKAAVNMEKTGFHPPFSAGANVSVKPIAQKVSQARAMLGRRAEVGAGALSPQFAQGVGKVAGLGQRAIPGIVAMGAQSPQPEPMQQDLQGFSGQMQQPQYTFQDAIMEAYSMFPNATESTILSTAKYLMEQRGGDQDIDTGTIQNVQQALQMIDEFGSGAAGKVSTITGKVGEFFGGASEGTRYRSLISDIRTKLIKQIAGTAQTPAEMKNLIDRLPEPTDEPAVARVKLEVLLNSLQGGFGAPSESQPINQDYDSWQN